jgi:sugar O-acyltransferase (sialic acid O-acetyltransferase NeuD family)
MMLLLLGGGGHCRSCIDVIETENQFQIAGIVQPRAAGAEPVLGYPILGDDDDLPGLLRRFPQALVTVGQIKTSVVRIRLYERLRALGADLPVIVSPNAHVSRHARIEEGTIVMHGAVVNAGAMVGRNCIINNRALIEHDVVIGDHSHVATAATVNGGVWVGAGSFIGSGAVVRQNVRIGTRCLIGMGQRVLADCPDGAVLSSKQG